jgi:ATP-dependent Clp protease protease subunit
MSSQPLHSISHMDDDENDNDNDKDKEKKEAGSRLASLLLLEGRTVLIQGGVDGKLAGKVVRELLTLEQDDPQAPVNIVLNSPGGSVTEGFAIYDVMRFISCPIRILCTGLTASIATVILLAAEKKYRLALPSTRFLIHQPLIMGQVIGPASDLEITANEIIKTREHVNQLLADETGQTLEKVTQDTQRDYWLSASEAVTYGLIDRVVMSRAEVGD